MTSQDHTRETALAAIAGAATIDALEAERVAALGKQGWISQLMKTLGQMSPEERLVEGPRIQGLRQDVSDAITGRKAALDHPILAAFMRERAQVWGAAAQTLDNPAPLDKPAP